VLGWPPSEAEIADASDIILALRAHGKAENRRMKTFGRMWGVKFEDDDDQQPKVGKTEATQLIKQMFGARRQ
jgi:hypothetical protein